MCGVWEHGRRETTDHSKDELTTEEWKAVIRSAASLRTRLFTLCGGEPLIRDDIFEIIRCARDHDMSVHVCSNAALLNPGDIVNLRDAGLNSISFSLDSPDRETTDALRGVGAYDAVLEGIHLLRTRAPNVHVGINATITARNFRNLHEIVPFAERLGVHQVKLAPIHTNLLHRKKRWSEVKDLLFRPELLDDLTAEVGKLIQATSRTKLRTTSRRFLRGIPGLYRGGNRFRCFAGYAICSIGPFGNVAPCCDMKGPWSVRSMPLEQIWRTEKFHAMRQRVDRCRRPCWDTTNTELSLRLRMRSLLWEIPRTWRDMSFYFNNGSHDSPKEHRHNEEAVASRHPHVRPGKPLRQGHPEHVGDRLR